jgi:hypothetical protein
MAMTGFDSRWTDFPAYIIGITKEIWEERGLATLNHYYAKDIIVRMANGITVGNAGVIAGTMATLAEFPDRTLLADDVVWCGTPETGMPAAGYDAAGLCSRGDRAPGRTGAGEAPLHARAGPAGPVRRAWQ